jgi:hypothetical protein
MACRLYDDCACANGSTIGPNATNYTNSAIGPNATTERPTQRAYANGARARSATDCAATAASAKTRARQARRQTSATR